MRRQSRLEEISQKRSLRNNIIILSGIIALTALFFFYGIPMVINLTLLFEKIKGNKDISIAVNSTSYIAPPILDPLKEATNSARIVVSGSGAPDQMIKLYVNGKYIGKAIVDKNKNFVFRDVALVAGENNIKTKAIISNKESGYSQNMSIVYKDKEPNLEISSPQDNQSISNSDGRVKVEGKTDPSVRVTVNSYWAIVETDGSFSYMLLLQKGENIVKVAAEDEAGNKTEKEIKIKLE